MASAGKATRATVISTRWRCSLTMGCVSEPFDDEDPTPVPLRIRSRQNLSERTRVMRRSAPLGVPVGFPEKPAPQEVTDPVDFWTRDPNDDARKLINELGIDGDKGVTLVQFVKLLIRQNDLERRRIKSDTDRQQTQHMLANQILEMNQAISPDHIIEMDRRLASAERWRKSVSKIVLATVIAAAGSLGGLGAMLWHRATQEGGDAVRLERVEKDLEKFGERFDKAIDQIHQELGRRSSSSPVSSASVALKGTP